MGIGINDTKAICDKQIYARQSGSILAAEVCVYPPNGGYYEEVNYTAEVVVTLQSSVSATPTPLVN